MAKKDTEKVPSLTGWGFRLGVTRFVTGRAVAPEESFLRLAVFFATCKAMPPRRAAYEERSIAMGVHFPAEIARYRFVHDRSDGREIRSDVMFESVFANVAQQLLHLRNFHHSR